MIDAQILIAIAQLCLTPHGNKDNGWIYREQLQCQAEYISCVRKHYKHSDIGNVLAECVMNKEKAQNEKDKKLRDARVK